ncbi:MAG: M23 family metallopeptidase [Caulobacterales bacterium]|nr:M23 family metallopeptidase [Caulobacterales bacterium]
MDLVATLKLASRARGRKAAAELAIVSTAALAAFAVAHASLPQPVRFVSRPAPAARTSPAVAPAATPPPADDFLISFVEPVPGHAVVSPFGLRQLPWEENGRLHEGVDISADAGVAVVAAADGVVAAAGEGSGYGRYVAVRHAEGLTTFYAHLGGIAPGMKPGVAIKAGQTVGKVGMTGTTTGPHLHFEIRDGQQRPLDPAMFLGKAFAEKGDLPLDKAKRYSGRVRIAYVSNIPESKRALMAVRTGAPVVIRKSNDAQDLAAAERNLAGLAHQGGKGDKMEGMKGLTIGPDGRPRAQLSL